MTYEQYGRIFGINALCSLFRFKQQKLKIELSEVKQ